MRFIVLEEEQLILQKFVGELRYDNWLQSAEEVWHHPKYDKLYRGLVDFRDADVKMGVPEVKSIVKLLTEDDEKAMRADTVILISEPTAAAFASIFADTAGDLFKTNIATTEEGAAAKVDADPSVFARLNGPDVVIKTFD